jgi:hypothetical protein
VLLVNSLYLSQLGSNDSSAIWLIQKMYMRDFYIFEIAVYLTDEDAYNCEREKRLDERLDELNSISISQGLTAVSPHTLQYAKDYFDKSYGGPWKFNQVVGWICLYAEPSYVGAHLWWVNAKRLQRKMKKVFYLTTSSMTHFYPEDDSDKIFQDTLEDIKRLSKKTPLKGRHIDLDPFMRIGPFVDWRKLLNNGSERR